MMKKKKLVRQIKELKLFIEQLQRENKSDFGLVLKHQQLQSDYIKLERSSAMRQQDGMRAREAFKDQRNTIFQLAIEKANLKADNAKLKSNSEELSRQFGDSLSTNHSLENDCRRLEAMLARSEKKLTEKNIICNNLYFEVMELKDQKALIEKLQNKAPATSTEVKLK